ncbi:hypothetical protein Bca52824_064357 [Brassica carinata]|uniref:Uncharacterized protein n=1 Tax=Brassica carinata TaxID=52824 RepID=A0A8X7QI74_BRACI|nr:hypothetical protein Bca52824_064357 [Brassica carinata]
MPTEEKRRTDRTRALDKCPQKLGACPHAADQNMVQKNPNRYEWKMPLELVIVAAPKGTYGGGWLKMMLRGVQNQP